MKTLEELKKEKQGLRQRIAEIEQLELEIEYQATLDRLGLVIGDKVEYLDRRDIKRRDIKTGIVCQATNYGNWLHVNLIGKNGATSNKRETSVMVKDEKIKKIS